MRRTLTALAVVVALCAPAAHGGNDAKEKAKQEAVAKELKALEGTWEIVFVEVGGKKGMLPENQKERLTFREKAFTAVQGEKVRDKGALHIDPTKKPKTLDMTSGGGANKGDVIRAIYELQGDEMRVCVSPPGQPRPTAFTTEAGSAHYIGTFRRVKDKK
jgi:uncharacterized protein (TIGR03067 family)